MRDPGLIAGDHEDDDKKVDLLLTYRRRAVDTIRTARTLTDGQTLYPNIWIFHSDSGWRSWVSRDLATTTLSDCKSMVEKQIGAVQCLAGHQDSKRGA
jgi:hypothetical protein